MIIVSRIIHVKVDRRLNVTNKFKYQRRLSSGLAIVMFRGTPCIFQIIDKIIVSRVTLWIRQCDFYMKGYIQLCLQKIKGGIGWNLRISGVKWYIQNIYLMFLSREIDIKLCQVYTQIHRYAILYKSCSIKQIIFNKYETNLKKIISHRSLKISGLFLL